jgi:hypothetical protein
VYHSHCIVKWLLRSASCPMCRSKLPTGWFFVQSLGTQIWILFFIWSKLPTDEYQSNWGGLSLCNILVNIVLDSLDIFFLSWFLQVIIMLVKIYSFSVIEILEQKYFIGFSVKKQKEVKLIMNWSHGRKQRFSVVLTAPCGCELLSFFFFFLV